MNRKRRVLREMLALDDKKKSLNVFDEARKDLLYQLHRKIVRNIEKKVDDDCPMLYCSQLFPKLKLENAQRTLKFRMKRNLNFLAHLNLIHRSKAKVDCHSRIAANRNSNLLERIGEQQHIDRLNKRVAYMIRSVPPSAISNSKFLRDDFDLISGPVIMRGTKYPIAIQNLWMAEIDCSLENPPSLCEYKRSLKVVMSINILGQGDIGKIKIMLNCNYQKFIERFMQQKSAECGFEKLTVGRVLKGLFIEIGNHSISGPRENFQDEASTNHEKHMSEECFTLPIGTIFFDDTASCSTNFFISLKKSVKLSKHHMVVGRVVYGMSVVGAVESYGSQSGRPVKFITAQPCSVFNSPLQC